MFGNVLTALTVILVATEASADRFSELRKNARARRGSFTTGSSQPTKTTFKSVGSAKCSASSWSQETALSKSGYAQAAAAAVTDLCNSPYWVKEDYDRARDKMKDYAVAYAQAQAEAYVECETSVVGKATAQACGYSEAYAEASVYAWASAFAEAVAIAADSCACVDDYTFAYTNAEQAVTLFAEARAHASAWACAYGNELSYAYSSVDCYAVAFADILAKAVAKAFQASACWPHQSDEIAYAEAKAWATIDVIEYDQCLITYAADGTAYPYYAGSSGTAVYPKY